MAPPDKAKAFSSEPKQKSLMGWLSKPAAGTPKTASKRPRVASRPEASSSPGRESDFQTPASNKGATVSHATYTKSSDGNTFDDTPPTSDPVSIDVDLLSDDDKPKAPVRRFRDTRIRSTELAQKRLKRKAVLEDSDEELSGAIDAIAYKKGLSAYRPSPEPESGGRTKKPRVSVPLSDEDEEEEIGESSFASRLSRFKKSPKKKARSAKSDDDDDFIVADSDEEEPTSRSASRTSVRSSRTSLLTDEDEDDDPVPKKSSKSTKPPLTKGGAPSGSNSSSFLTAAERRAQATKQDKKSQEDPFAFLVDPKDKDGVRPGEPGYDPRTLYIPKKAWAEFTPFEKQFWEIKQNHYDTVLFFQKGKFLELYEEDARIGHRDFDLKLTQRVKMSMVGVPEMSFNFWAAKFLAKGYKVGRVDQAETALGAEMRVAATKSKTKIAEDKQKEKIVRRELHKVYTNGTLVDEELLTDEQAGHCVSIREEEDEGAHGSFGVCVLDSATSEFNLSAFEDDVCRTRLETLMRQLRPKEIIFTKGTLSVSTTRLLKSILPTSCLWTSLRDVEGFNYAKTLKELKTLYGNGDEDAMDDDDDDMSFVPDAIKEMLGCKSAIEALGSMIWYLRQLNIDKDILTMRNFNIYDPMKRGQGLILDGQTLAHIEVLLNNEGTEEGSLLKLLGRCITPFGKRLFRIWLCLPLREVADINARLDAVEDLMNHPQFELDFMTVARGLPDLERIVSRIHAKNCKVKDFLKVLKSFKQLSKGLVDLADASESFDSKTILGLLRSAPNLLPNIKNVESRFLKPENDNDELLPVEGKDDEYDGIAGEIKSLEEELEGELKKMAKKTGLSLTYWHSATGNKDIYLVQTKASADDIPDEWIKSGGTKAYARWKVPALSSTIRALKEARETRSTIIKSFKFRLFGEFDKDRGVWLRAIRVMAELDCLLSLAKSSNAIGEPACRPEFVEGDTAWIDFKELRHPAMASRTKIDFIPNDVKLGGDVGRIALLTGAGKSTVMRMTATGVIMAQLGMFVPAEKARLCPVDSILTRMGAYDNMFSNASTFKVELDECCKILRDATPKSLVILDELGRGTSTYDGMAIAGAVLHQLATYTLPLSFFATHYGSLTDDFAYHPNIRNMHMETMVDDEKRELVFLYKLIEGIATSSFGTHVANLAGVPMDVVQRAEVVSKDFADQFKLKMEGKRKKSASVRLPIDAQADFAYLYGLATGKYELDPNPVRQREVLKGMRAAVARMMRK
ncbi:DNA mismatch repair protein Msh6 [Artomyces pyxidatus]|uniref:DNA mismatch repair protein Msh6 n=1 Tax=Artomyces pyxidatus TaxID=48021 RepID=A0ACB8TET5_9AGAM|nr:DNA mismatch repair protein Msh6 [Artomyces pyxidatus]